MEKWSAWTANQMYQTLNNGSFHAYCLAAQSKSLKFTWIHKLFMAQFETAFWDKQLESCFTITLKELFTSNLSFKDISRVTARRARVLPMWTSILQLWCNFHFVQSPSMLGDTPLFLNSATLKTELNVFRRSKVIAFGIETVAQAFLLAKMRTCKRIRKAVPKQCQNAPVLAATDTHIKDATTALLSPQGKGRHVYKILVELLAPKECKAVKKWQDELLIDDVQERWPTIINHMQHLSQVKLKAFYLRFITFSYLTKYQGVKNFTLVARLGEKCNISCSSL